jgi:periplasmic mercuric ion binding protein
LHNGHVITFFALKLPNVLNRKLLNSTPNLLNMRNTFLIAVILIFSGVAVYSQSVKKTEEIKILTSAQCGQCKTRIETAMAYEKGVVKSSLDVDSKILTVIYKIGKTTPDKIRMAVAAVGYDADEITADEKAYKNLPACCKKSDDPEHTGH